MHFIVAAWPIQVCGHSTTVSSRVCLVALTLSSGNPAMSTKYWATLLSLDRYGPCQLLASAPLDSCRFAKAYLYSCDARTYCRIIGISPFMHIFRIATRSCKVTVSSVITRQGAILAA